MGYSQTVQIVIGLGGNLGGVEQAFRQAVCDLHSSPGLEVSERSSLYRSRPVGPEQPDYLNAAILVEADMDPRTLLQRCLEIEKHAGRDRSTEVRWGPRCIDLDLLVAERLLCSGRALVLPHPRLAERTFALVPAAEVAPHWIHALAGRSLSDLAADALHGDPQAVEVVGRW